MDFGQRQMKWGARLIDHEYFGAWGWRLSPKEAAVLLGFLEDMGAKTWREIEGERTNGHKKHHDMDVSGLAKEAQDRIRHCFANEEAPETLFRFRLSGAMRLWGLRRRGHFELLWFDRDHKVYPVER